MSFGTYRLGLRGVLLMALLTKPQAPNVRKADLRELYVEDQRDRGVPLAANGEDMLSSKEASKLPEYDWEREIPERDDARRTEARKLLSNPRLSGQDYYYAAFLFQHGTSSEDYLLAHILAMDAMARGYTPAKWISAASLDRYLQEIGQKQVFGTQYRTDQSAYYLQHKNMPNIAAEMKSRSTSQTLEPYYPGLIDDHIRTEFCVPSLRRQEQHIADARTGKVKVSDLPRVNPCP